MKVQLLTVKCTSWGEKQPLKCARRGYKCVHEARRGRMIVQKCQTDARVVGHFKLNVFRVQQEAFACLRATGVLGDLLLVLSILNLQLGLQRLALLALLLYLCCGCGGCLLRECYLLLNCHQHSLRPIQPVHTIATAQRAVIDWRVT